jgi:hypothetical protein
MGHPERNRSYRFSHFPQKNISKRNAQPKGKVLQQLVLGGRAANFVSR